MSAASLSPGLVLACALVACGPPDAFRSLPAADRARWERCLAPISRVNGCDTSSKDIEAGLVQQLLDQRCLDKKAPKAEYVKTAEPQRPGWLRARGCPEETMEGTARGR